LLVTGGIEPASVGDVPLELAWQAITRKIASNRRERRMAAANANAVALVAL
jgi:hypothetical protein